jgi:hypothetical protein
MAYCTKCGKKNDDDAAFCNSCGAPIQAPVAGGPEPMHPPVSTPPGAAPPPPTPPRPPKHYDHDRDWDDRCEQECAGTNKKYSWLWGALIILIGIFLIFELGIKNIEGMPDWITEFEFWWVIPVLIGILIILAGVEAISRAGRQR